jgi:hypothetical protein
MSRAEKNIRDIPISTDKAFLLAPKNQIKAGQEQIATEAARANPIPVLNFHATAAITGTCMRSSMSPKEFILSV